MGEGVSPAVLRAVEAAEKRAGAGGVRPVDLLLSLLEDDEGRPAKLLESLGVDLAGFRTAAAHHQRNGGATLRVQSLLSEAREIALARRHDPTLTTDFLLLALLHKAADLRRLVEPLGVDFGAIDTLLGGAAAEDSGPPFVPPPIDGDANTVVLPAPVPAPPPRPPSPPAHELLPTDRIDAARVLDANFNRAREALRAAEDYCRFALDDRVLTGELKALRHGLAAAAGRLPAGLLLAARETQHDVGTEASADGEYLRSGPTEVAVVNLKRLQESLRSLEEFGKVFGPELGRELERLRYRSYTLERTLGSIADARRRLADARLYFLLTTAQCVGDPERTVREAAAGGVDVVQFREKDLPDRQLIALARRVRRWTRDAGVAFVVNDRPDVARLAEADGVHLGQDDLTVKDARRVLGPDALIGVSTHTLEQLRAAVLDGATYVGVGPTFPSTTKQFTEFAGLEFVSAAMVATSLPAFALGGIGPDNVARVVAAGAKRVAVSAAIARAADPRLAARALRNALGR